MDDTYSPDWPHDQGFELSAEASPEESFAQAWAIYPRHEAKKDAFKSWLQLKPDAALVERILENIKTREWPNLTKHQPLFASYIRGYRWTDEPGVNRPAAPANRWQPAKPSRLIYGGMGILCEHDPICESDIEHIRKTQNLVDSRTGGGVG
jgi:hypothetical protein